jgi:hypothetical protein
MDATTRRLMSWTPRILCLAFAGFLCIFAMDVFDMPLGFWTKILALLMHLVPAAIVLVVLAVVWRREWMAAILFPLLAVIHLVTKWGQLDWSGYAVIDGPLLLLGALFLINWHNRATLRPNAR